MLTDASIVRNPVVSTTCSERKKAFQRNEWGSPVTVSQKNSKSVSSISFGGLEFVPGESWHRLDSEAIQPDCLLAPDQRDESCRLGSGT